MSLNVEQKLELTREIRKEQLFNRREMIKREDLVYGPSIARKRRKEDPLYAAEMEEAEASEKKNSKKNSGLPFRSFIAIILLTVFLMMKYQNVKIGDLDYKLLVESFRSTEFIKGIDFETLFPYTEESETESETETE